MNAQQEEKRVKRNQYLLAVSLIILFMIIVMMLVRPSGEHSVNSPLKQAENAIQISKTVTQLDPQEEWQLRSESKLEAMSQAIKQLEAENKKLKATELPTDVVEQKVSKMLEQQQQQSMILLSQLSEQVKELQTNIKSIKQTRDTATLSSTSMNPINFLQGLTEEESNASSYPYSTNHVSSKPAVVLHSIALTQTKTANTESGKKSLHHYLPVGSYVKAMILSGVSAAAAVRSKSEPRPILFRVTSPAVTANHQTIDLTGCLVTGEAYGDVSSERAFVRLHDMTCSREDGVVIETPVQGYAAAKGTGISGRLVRREGDLLARAFWSGLFGGLGKSATDANSSISESALGVVKSVKGKDVFTHALGQGVAGAADRISQYHIERAEQYHPVIEINAGREVELVFIQGVYLDGRSTHVEQPRHQKTLQQKIKHVING